MVEYEGYCVLSFILLKQTVWAKWRLHKQCTIEAAGLFIIGLLIVVYLQINQRKLNTPSKLHHSKGQMKSEWIYAVTNFPNYQLKYCKDFCPDSFEDEYFLIKDNLTRYFSILKLGLPCVLKVINITF